MIVTYPFINQRGIFRPYVPIVVINPMESIRSVAATMALLDTGADSCILPAYLATATGHNLKGQGVLSSVNQGVGERKVTTWKHTFIITLQSPDQKKSVWQSSPFLINCLDHNNAPALLGQKEFLSNFKILFDYPNKRVELDIP